MLAWLGRLVHRGRWVSLVLILVLTAGAAGWGMGVFSKFKEGGFEDPDAPSTLVAKLGNTYFGSTNPDVLVLYSSSEYEVDDPEFKRAVQSTLRKLPKDKVVEQISYWSFKPSDAESFASRDGHKTFVSLKMAGDDGETKLANLDEIRDLLPAPGLETRIGGSVPLGQEFASQVVADIVRAELITAGPLLILLVILFGALVASVLPLLVAMFSIAGGLAVVHAVTYVTGVTSFALEVVTMMGVGLAIDYSLFIVSRFREELARGMTAYGIPPAPPSGDRAGRKAYKRAMLPVRRE
ncbi:MMPL family transporter, partial [Actinomadura adrarensis]